MEIPLIEIVHEFYQLSIIYPYKKKLMEIFGKVHKRLVKQDPGYSVCYPSIKEIIRYELDRDDYSSESCEDYASDILNEVWIEYRRWAFQQAIKFSLKAFKLVQNI